MHLRIRPVSADINLLGVFRTSQFPHHILGKIDQYRPRPSRSGYIESFFNDPSQVLPVADRHPILRDTSGNSYDIYLLKRIIADQMSCHLSGEAHQRNTVIICRCKPRDKVRRPRSAGHQAHAHLSRRPGISIRFMHQRHLLPWKDHLRIILLVQFVADVDRAGARITEYSIYPFFL